MSGLVHSSDLGASGLAGDWKLFRFTGEAGGLASNSAWVIPSQATMLYIEVIGGGGAGTGSWPANAPGKDVAGGGGGGGGAFAWGMYSVAHLKTAGITTLNVTCGAKATATVGSGTDPSDGTMGNTSSVIGTASTSGYGNLTLRAYGGAGGTATDGSSGGVGGGGGGTGSIGIRGILVSGAGGKGGAGGAPYCNGLNNTSTSTNVKEGIGGGGGSGGHNEGGSATDFTSCGQSAEYGGGGGGCPNNALGGGSVFGGGGGGGNAGSYQDTHGGAWNNFTQGGAGNGFDTNDTQTSSVAAAAGTSRKYGCGDGGAGLHNGPYDHANEIGGDGGSPGGGGGASEKNTVGHVRGGHGGRGEVRIWAI